MAVVSPVSSPAAGAGAAEEAARATTDARAGRVAWSASERRIAVEREAGTRDDAARGRDAATAARGAEARRLGRARAAGAIAADAEREMTVEYIVADLAREAVPGLPPPGWVIDNELRLRKRVAVRRGSIRARAPRHPAP
jgi:hypothetical protein